MSVPQSRYAISQPVYWVDALPVSIEGGTFSFSLANSIPYHIVASAGINANVVKDTAGVLTGWSVTNNTGYAIFVKIFDKATTPDPAVDTAVKTIGVQSGLTVEKSLTYPLSFVNGIALAIVKQIADHDVTPVAANDCVVDLEWQ